MGASGEEHFESDYKNFILIRLYTHDFRSHKTYKFLYLQSVSSYLLHLQKHFMKTEFLVTNTFFGLSLLESYPKDGVNKILRNDNTLLIGYTVY